MASPSNYSSGNNVVCSHRAGVPNNASKVIDKKYYTTIEDRPIDQEQVDRHREHNLYEKDFKQVCHDLIDIVLQFQAADLQCWSF